MKCESTQISDPERKRLAMANGTIEHVNITVSSPERTAAMLTHLFGWKIRWQGAAASGGRTIHVGTPNDYIAVYSPEGSDGVPLAHGKGQPLNHIGVTVDDLEGVERRARALGLVPFNHDTYAPGRRFYLFDYDGIEWEIVCYA
jgi:catechol 2,3-dioxygenase-like lactoylglutathione lyase family enzyme